MPAPLSPDLRLRIFSVFQKGGVSTNALASRFKVGRVTVWRLLRRALSDGTLEPLPHGGGREFSIPPEKEGRVQKLIKKHPDATTEELAQLYNRRWKVNVTKSSMGRTLSRMNISSKKSLSSDGAKPPRRHRKTQAIREEAKKARP